MGQIIAVGLVSGGIFTTQKGKYNQIPIWKFFICALVDSQATLLIVNSYTFTTITSVMILQQFTIPSVILLSIFGLKIRYLCNHYIALIFCLASLSCSLVNDIVIYPQQGQEGDEERSLTLTAFYGDLMVIGGAFLYALSNILQEYLLKSGADVFNYLGFLGVFGTIITLIESMIIFREYEQFYEYDEENLPYIIGSFIGFTLLNVLTYTVIPFFIRRSGATLLNISNLTTIIWSMISDIFLFNSSFYILYIGGFFLDLIAIFIYSLKSPINLSQEGKPSPFRVYRSASRSNQINSTLDQSVPPRDISLEKIQFSGKEIKEQDIEEDNNSIDSGEKIFSFSPSELPNFINHQNSPKEGNYHNQKSKSYGGDKILQNRNIEQNSLLRFNHQYMSQKDITLLRDQTYDTEPDTVIKQNYKNEMEEPLIIPNSVMMRKYTDA